MERLDGVREHRGVAELQVETARVDLGQVSEKREVMARSRATRVETA
jgi:hypothetical protein